MLFAATPVVGSFRGCIAVSGLSVQAFLLMEMAYEVSADAASIFSCIVIQLHCYSAALFQPYNSATA
jgi:hypothetical protein